jgi:crotonobetainyl-CoA:carnitine CoA-transferase CaiB-like acyl-CoA transferase
VPYRGFKTSDGDILLGGGNDRLFGILCDRLQKPEWKTDPRFFVNNERVKNRVELEKMIEDITQTKTTKEWLEVLNESGMPYAAVNDVQDTLNHEHGTFSLPFTWSQWQKLIRPSTSTRDGARGRAFDLWPNEARQYTGEILLLKTQYQECASHVRSAHG